MVVISIVLPVLWGVALLLRRGAPPAVAAAVEPPALTDVTPRWLSWKTASALLALVVFSGVTTEGWYRSHERGAPTNVHWSVVWPTNQSAFGELEISDTARATLRCNEGRGVNWTDAQANQWRMFFLRWEPGKNSAQLAKGHTPDICLPGTGHQLRAEHARVTVAVQGVELSFRHYEFASGARTLFVFYCLWEDRPSNLETVVTEDGTQTSRLQAVRAGRRNLGQQVIELAVEGPVTPQQSIDQLRAQLAQLIVRDAGGSQPLK